jgi:hypothetical protein
MEGQDSLSHTQKKKDRKAFCIDKRKGITRGFVTGDKLRLYCATILGRSK